MIHVVATIRILRVNNQKPDSSRFIRIESANSEDDGTVVLQIDEDLYAVDSEELMEAVSKASTRNIHTGK